jgi:RNA polymerase sigma factor (sigma-70 family)
LGKPYDAVFPEVYRQAVDRKLGRPAERVYTVLELAPWQQQANLLPSPEDAYVQVELADHVERAMETLSEREATVLRMRYGLGGIGEHSLDEIGAHFGVSRERIRQNELKALCKLKHPSRSKYLKSFKEVIS